MYNRYPLWKNLLVVVLVALGIIYAAPNLYPPDPAVQISGESGATQMDQTVVDRAVNALEAENISVKASELTAGAVLVRLNSLEQQLHAKEVVEKAMGGQFVVALNLADSTPGWLRAMGASPMKLGLDLAGGVHFLLEVDTDSMIKKNVESTATDLRRELIAANLKNRQWSVRQDERQIVARFPTAESRDEGLKVIRDRFPDLMRVESEVNGQFVVTMTINEQKIRELESYAVTQNVTSLRNRVNELGVAEPLVQRQGRNRIVVELPGVQDAAQAKRIIGKTANLEFRMVAAPESSPSMREKLPFMNRPGVAYELEKQVIVTGDQVTSASSSFDSQTGMPQVNITLDSDGGAKMNRVTRNNVGRAMGVVFIESRSELQTKRNAEGVEEEVRVRSIDKNIINVATVQSALGVQFRITGLDSNAEAAELALLLRAGALVAPVDFIEERTIGPSLGADNIERGFKSTLWGFVAIAVFMIIYYHVFGVVSVTALAANVVMLIALLGVMQATLTLPGIAAIALTLGMAIDANVLINERIREELRSGVPAQAAIRAGYDRAFATIVDANVTTFIAGFMLLLFGTGPVRGFAVVHCLGIITSIISSVMVSRALVNWIYGSRPNVRKLAIGQVWEHGLTTHGPTTVAATKEGEV